MHVDLEYLRQHYGSLSDEAVLAIDRSDLVERAQQYYDAEMRERGLTNPGGGSQPFKQREVAPAFDDRSRVREPISKHSPESPSWLGEAAEAYSVAVLSNRVEDELAEIRSVLDAAGIPSHLQLTEMTELERRVPTATHCWHVLVPAYLNFRAMSTIKRDISNRDFEDAWKAHLEGLSGDQLLAATPETELCDLYDCIERASRAYNDEISRRGLKVESHREPARRIV